MHPSQHQIASADIVANCAGVTGKTNIKTHEVELDNFNFVFNVNVNGIFLICKSGSTKTLYHIFAEHAMSMFEA